MNDNRDLLEARIRAAKPRAPDLPSDFSARVMAEIEHRGLVVASPRMRAVKTAVRWGFAVGMLVLGVLLANALAFELRMNGSLELLYFGSSFLGSFLARLPYDLLSAVLVLGALAGWLFRGGRLARVRMAWVVLVTYAFTGIGGLALAESGLNEDLQTRVEEKQITWPLFTDFYRHRARYANPNPRFRMGRVITQKDGTVVLVTPNGDEVKVRLPPGMRVRVGDHLRLMGRFEHGRFDAGRAQFCNNKRMQHYFHHQRMMRGRNRGGPGMRGMGPMMGPGRRMMRGMDSMMGPERRMGGGMDFQSGAAPEPGSEGASPAR